MALAKPVTLADTKDSPPHITEIFSPGGMVGGEYTEPRVDFSCVCGAKGGDTLIGTLPDTRSPVPGAVVGGYMQLWKFREVHKGRWDAERERHVDE